MLSLEQLHELISKLTELEDKDVIQAGIEDIFYQLIYEGQIFYTVLTSDGPYLAPTSRDTQHVYLRLFSHKELADKFISKASQVKSLTMTAVESVQMAKSAFKAGVYGYLLNEGDKWITISLSEYLKIFLTRILKEPVMFNQECADLVTFVGELRQPNSVPYQVEYDGDGQAKVVDGCLSITLAEEKRLMDDPADTKTMPISPSALFATEAEKILVETPRGEVAAPTPLLLGALAYCGLNKNSPAMVSIDTETLTDWRISDVQDFAVAFEPITVIPKQPEPDEEPATDEDLSKPSKSSKFALPHLPPIVEIKSSVISKFSELSEKVKAKLPHKAQQEVDKSSEPEAPAVENVEPTSEALQQPEAEATPPKESFWTTKRKQVAAISAGICLLAVIVGSVFVVKHIQYQQAFEQFCTYVSQQDYGNAYTLYRDNGFGVDADDYLKEEIDQLILRYANNSIGAEELAASLRALNNFPSVEQSLLTAQVVASKLEASKNAYVQGKEAEDGYTRLNLWRQVIDLDTVNYAAAKQHVEDNRDSYIKELNDKITYYSTRVRSFAVDRYEVLAYWYPDCAEAQHWAEEYAADRTTPLSYYPLSISNVSIKQMASGYWTLHIDWENTSVKSIKEVCFSVIAVDSAGNPVVNSDTHGSWTIFDARDIGPYAPGEGTPSSDYVWNYVFYGPMVAKVKLTAVNVTYSDGSIVTFTENVDLAKIYRDF